MFYNCYSLTSITIPSSVTSLGGSAFYGCTRLVSVTIPASVTSIGDSAFKNCASLTIIYCNSTTPPTLANVNALSGINANYLIKVSAGSVAAYKAATNWITIASHIVSQ
jgi:surface protein